MSVLLHETNLIHVPLSGPILRQQLLRRITEVQTLANNGSAPNVTILIRTRNDMAYLPSLLQDIADQNYSGKIEVLLVDTESTDGTIEYARSHGANIVSIAQTNFTYPRSLNLGFKAARYPYIMTIVGHSNLASRYVLQVLMQWHNSKNFGGIYSYPLPNWNASKTERLGWTFGGRKWLRNSQIMSTMEMGMLGANCAIVCKAAWQAVGGYDEAYAGGGEDGALAATMLAAGYTIVRDPLMSVYHSHHLGPWNMFRQYRHWQTIAKPTIFNAASIYARRPDLRH